MESEANLQQLICRKGCGGTLLETDDPEIFKCKFCDSLYLVKREGNGSLSILRELKIGLEGVASLQLLLEPKIKLGIEKENLIKRLKEIEEKVRKLSGWGYCIESDDIKFSAFDKIFQHGDTKKLGKEYKEIATRLKEINSRLIEFEPKIQEARFKTRKALNKNDEFVCHVCNSIVSAGANFCRNCGAKTG